MPVRFKGLSEYQRNFLWKNSYLSESYNPSVRQKYSRAGLRSDQLGITKEPSFISKRRVPYHDPQISKFLEWNGAITENEMVVPPEPQTLQTPKPQEAQQKEDADQDGVPSLEASRVPKRTRSHSADSRAEGPPDAVEKHQAITGNHALANEDAALDPSLKPLPQSVDPRVLRNKSQIIPQFNGSTVVHETEYTQNFKGLSPVKEPKFREDLKGSSGLETPSPEKKADEPLELEVEMASEDSDQPKRKLAPWRHQRLGKVNSEYRAKFLSPAQYLYRAGAWTRMKENIPNQGSLGAMWYAEVKELREKAESYRKRIQGTHFSRDHLNQILSENNYCWDVSSTTSSEGTVSGNIRALDLAGDLTGHKTPQKHPPAKLEERKVALGEQPPGNATAKLDLAEAATMPVRRRLAWDTEDTKEDAQEQPRGEEDREEGREKAKQTRVGELEELDTQETFKADRIKEGSELSSVSSGRGGRLPTPKLRELGIQRTHHDLTTPAVGGAVLVSPCKTKRSTPEQWKRASYQHGLETPKKDVTKKENHRAVCLLTSPAAGMKTVDPLPLREDSEDDGLRFLKIREPLTNIPGSQPSPSALPHWPPPNRIQGRLRHPEFQHNVRKPRTNTLLLPPHEAFNDEDVDRLSEISARSAASSLRACQTLARAQKRKENFWGKT